MLSSDLNVPKGLEEQVLCSVLAGKGLGSTSPLNWGRLRYLAHRHGVLHQLNESIKRYGYDTPRSFQHKVQEHLLVKFHRSTKIIQELLRLDEHFKKLDLPVLFYKGPALSQYLYGSASARPSVDLDILAHPSHIEEILAGLYQNGYRSHSNRSVEPFLRFDCEFSVESPSGVHVELHWNVLPPRWGAEVPFDNWYSDRIEVSICGHSLAAPSPENLVFALCAHGAKHRWEKWKLVHDIHVLCAKTLDWTKILSSCKEQGFLRILYVSLKLAQASFGLQLPEEIQTLVDSDKVAQGLAHEVLVDLEQSKPPVEGLSRRFFELRLRERGIDQLRYLVQAVVGPGVRDIQYCRLPKSWENLYYLVRPIRWFSNRIRRAPDSE